MKKKKRTGRVLSQYTCGGGVVAVWRQCGGGVVVVGGVGGGGGFGW